MCESTMPRRHSLTVEPQVSCFSGSRVIAWSVHKECPRPKKHHAAEGAKIRLEAQIIRRTSSPASSGPQMIPSLHSLRLSIRGSVAHKLLLLAYDQIPKHQDSTAWRDAPLQFWLGILLCLQPSCLQAAERNASLLDVSLRVSATARTLLQQRG